MIKVDCKDCGQELKVPGAILLSPPDDEGKVLKEHICTDCYQTYYTKDD